MARNVYPPSNETAGIRLGRESEIYRLQETDSGRKSEGEREIQHPVCTVSGLRGDCMRDRREPRNKKQLWFVRFLTSVMNREMPMAARSTPTQFSTCSLHPSTVQKKKIKEG